jgi:magnesium transporter
MELEEEILAMLAEKKYSAIKERLDSMNPIDVAEFLSEVPDDKCPVLFRLLSKEQAADAFVEMDHDAQMVLIHKFSDNELKNVLEEMFLDDTVDLIEEMPANVVNRILANADSETRKGINEILNYPDD